MKCFINYKAKFNASISLFYDAVYNLQSTYFTKTYCTVQKLLSEGRRTVHDAVFKPGRGEMKITNGGVFKRLSVNCKKF